MTTKIEKAAIEVDTEMVVLHEDDGSFTGYSWRSMCKKDPGADIDRGVPASVFEVALWNALQKKQRELELVVSKFNVASETAAAKIIELSDKLSKYAPLDEGYYYSDELERERE